MIVFFKTMMNTMPRRDKIIVLVILLLVVLAWTVDSILHPRIENSDLNNVAAMVAKDLNPSLFPTDLTFSEPSFYQSYTPTYRWLVARSWAWSGSFELGLVWLAPIALSLYLAGMFILSYWATQNSWLALGLTVASAHYHETIGAEVWGIGGSNLLMARAIFMVVVPYLTLWFIYTSQHFSAVNAALLGLGIGLAANLHPPSGMHITVLIVGILILGFGFRQPGWAVWGKIGLTVSLIFVGAWPIIAGVAGHATAAEPVAVSFERFSQVVAERFPLPFWPGVYKWYGFEIGRPLLDVLVWIYFCFASIGFMLYLWFCWRAAGSVHQWRWVWLAAGLITVGYGYLVAYFEMGLLFALVAGYIIDRFRRANFTAMDWLMLGLMVLTILLSFVGYYLMSLIWQRFELPFLTPILISQVRAARFIYLPGYILAGFAAAASLTPVSVWLGRLVRGGTTLGEGHHSIKGHVAVALGLFLSLLPSLSDISTLQEIWPIVVFLATVCGFIGLCLVFREQLLPYSALLPPLVIALLVVILFGPLAALFSPILPIPAVNLLLAANRSPDPAWPETDAELYAWVRQSTPPDALFFWCDFGPSTTLRFRREAQRSITHNWKDLGWAINRGMSLAPLLENYRVLEKACANMNDTVSTAYAVGANYILVPKSKAVELLAASCFANDRYLVFGLGAQACVSTNIDWSNKD